MKTNRKILILCLVLTALGGRLAPSLAAERRPLPEKEALEKAVNLVRELFPAGGASNDPAARRTLAGKLLEEALKNKADAASHFALLDAAWKAAADGGDWETAAKALDALDASFLTRTAKLRVQALTRVGQSVLLTKDQRETLPDYWLSVADAAVKEKSFEQSEQAAEHARLQARSLGLKQKENAADAKLKFVAKEKKSWEEAQAALQTLRGKPDDPEANRLFGLYLLQRCDDWGRARAHLAQTNDANWAKIVELEDSQPLGAEAMATAELWVEQARKIEDEFPGSAAWARAGTWYQKSLAGLSGLQKTKAERGLALAGERLALAAKSSEAALPAETADQWLQRRRRELAQLVPPELRDNFAQFRRSLYLFVPESRDLKKAAAECEKWGGKVLSVETKEENDFIVQWLRNRLKADLWLGCTYNPARMQFVWFSGQPWGYVNWDAEPKKDDLNADAGAVLVFGRDSRWRIARWRQTGAFVCEWERPLLPENGAVTPEVIQGSYQIVQESAITDWRITFYRNMSVVRMFHSGNPMHRNSISGTYQIQERTARIRWNNGSNEFYVFEKDFSFAGKDWQNKDVALIPLE